MSARYVVPIGAPRDGPGFRGVRSIVVTRRPAAYRRKGRTAPAGGRISTTRATRPGGAYRALRPPRPACPVSVMGRGAGRAGHRPRRGADELSPESLERCTG